MTVLRPRRVIIKGMRWLDRRALEDNITSVTEATQELIELADFQLTALPKWVGAAPTFRLSTAKDINNDGMWVHLFGSFYIDEDGEPEVIEL